MQFIHPRSLFFLILVFSTVVNGIRHEPTDDKKGVHIICTIIVDQSGQGNFKTIQAAIDSIPVGNINWVKIQIAPGIYTEKVTIPKGKSYVYLKGQGRRITVVTYSDHEQTDTSATFSSIPDYVLVQGITFKNSYNRASNYHPSLHSLGVRQALSARIYGDKSAFIGCGFVGFQDTLWDVRGRHYFKDCYVEGAVDFIFGSGQSFYENPVINVTIGKIGDTLGYITAQGRSSVEDTSGFVFSGGAVFGIGKALLGRAYGGYSRVIFDATKLGNVVAPQGWDAWYFQGAEENFIYVEIACSGQGSNTAGRVPWESKLNLNDISKMYSKSAFIDQDNWISTLPIGSSI